MLGVAASMLFHLSFLTALVLGAHTVFHAKPSATDIQIELLRPPVTRPKPRPPKAQRASPVAVLRPHEARTPPPPSAPAPFVVAPAPPRPAAAPATPAPEPARSPLLGLGEAMAKVLGCSDSARTGMTDAQRAACDKRLAEDVRNAKKLPLMIPPEKKAAWDREMWKRHKPMGDPMVPCTGPGSNFGFACIPDKVKPPPASND